MAIQVLDATTPIPTTALTVSPTGLPTLERMQERMHQQKAMRQLLVQYVKSEMDPARHFYTVGDSDKPALSQDGARNLCSLYEVRVGDVQLDEAYLEDGHYTCKATVLLYSLAAGVEIGRGTGSCSTRESKYAWRWAWPNEVSKTLNKADLKTKTTRKGQMLYRVPNDDLADQYNTVLKMAEKRALVAATLRLPLVSELFSTSAEDDEDRDADRKGLLRQVGVWVRKLDRAARLRAILALFGVESFEAVQALTYEQLDTGLMRIEGLEDGGINWTSKTLVEDIRRLEGASAEQAKGDLFGDQAEVHAAQQAAREGTARREAPQPEVDPETGELLPEEDDPRQDSLFTTEASAAADRELAEDID